MESKIDVTFETKLVLNEGEARALSALAMYDNKEFLKVFYEKLGKTYLQPYEKGFISMFDKIKIQLAKELKTVDKARKLLQEEL